MDSPRLILSFCVTVLHIIFNGLKENYDLRFMTVQDLLDLTQEDDPAVIVEINGRFIYRREFKTIFINEGDRVEFIHPSFGG